MVDGLQGDEQQKGAEVMGRMSVECICFYSASSGPSPVQEQYGSIAPALLGPIPIVPCRGCGVTHRDFSPLSPSQHNSALLLLHFRIQNAFGGVKSKSGTVGWYYFPCRSGGHLVKLAGALNVRGWSS